MKKLFAVLYVALLGAILASTSFAGTNVGVRWNDFSPGLSRAGGAVRDPMTLLSGDTLRTGNISTDDWDWTLNGGAAATTTAMQIATITFMTTGTQLAANIVGDTLYFSIERGVKNTNGSITYVPDTYQPAVPLGTYAGGIGNHALNMLPYGDGDAGTHAWIGGLYFDRDGVANTIVPHNNLWGVKNFRLLIHGDIGSTAQAVGGCRVVITYPEVHFIAQ